MTRKLTRRRVLAAATAATTAAATGSFFTSAQAAPEAQKITQQLIDAAKKEGKVT